MLHRKISASDAIRIAIERIGSVATMLEGGTCARDALLETIEELDALDADLAKDPSST